MAGFRSHRDGPVRLLPALLLFLLLAGPAHAARLRPLNIEDLTLRADRIFSGRCVDVVTGTDAELGMAVTHVTFVPRRVVKGPTHGPVTIKMLGNLAGPVRGRGDVDGVPLFHKGEEVVLFLYGESRRGLTSPVGLSQGKFLVIAEKGGGRIAINGLANEHLLKSLSIKAQRRLEHHVRREGRRPLVGEAALLDMAESLLREEGQP